MVAVRIISIIVPFIAPIIHGIGENMRNNLFYKKLLPLLVIVFILSSAVLLGELRASETDKKPVQLGLGLLSNELPHIDYIQWSKERGYKTYGDFGEGKFIHLIKKAMDEADEIHFNLDGILFEDPFYYVSNISGAGQIDHMENPIKKHTNYELYLIKTNNEYFDKTTWHKGNEVMPKGYDPFEDLTIRRYEIFFTSGYGTKEIYAGEAIEVILKIEPNRLAGRFGVTIKSSDDRIASLKNAREEFNGSKNEIRVNVKGVAKGKARITAKLTNERYGPLKINSRPVDIKDFLNVEVVEPLEIAFEPEEFRLQTGHTSPPPAVFLTRNRSEEELVVDLQAASGDEDIASPIEKNRITFPAGKHKIQVPIAAGNKGGRALITAEARDERGRLIRADLVVNVDEPLRLWFEPNEVVLTQGSSAPETVFLYRNHDDPTPLDIRLEYFIRFHAPPDRPPDNSIAYPTNSAPVFPDARLDIPVMVRSGPNAGEVGIVAVARDRDGQELARSNELRVFVHEPLRLEFSDRHNGPLIETITMQLGPESVYRTNPSRTVVLQRQGNVPGRLQISMEGFDRRIAYPSNADTVFPHDGVISIPVLVRTAGVGQTTIHANGVVDGRTVSTATLIVVVEREDGDDEPDGSGNGNLAELSDALQRLIGRFGDRTPLIPPPEQVPLLPAAGASRQGTGYLGMFFSAASEKAAQKMALPPAQTPAESYALLPSATVVNEAENKRSFHRAVSKRMAEGNFRIDVSGPTGLMNELTEARKKIDAAITAHKQKEKMAIEQAYRRFLSSLPSQQREHLKSARVFYDKFQAAGEQYRPLFDKLSKARLFGNAAVAYYRVGARGVCQVIAQKGCSELLGYFRNILMVAGGEAGPVGIFAAAVAGEGISHLVCNVVIPALFMPESWLTENIHALDSAGGREVVYSEDQDISNFIKVFYTGEPVNNSARFGAPPGIDFFSRYGTSRERILEDFETMGRFNKALEQHLLKLWEKYPELRSFLDIRKEAKAKAIWELIYETAIKDLSRAIRVELNKFIEIRPPVEDLKTTVTNDWLSGLIDTSPLTVIRGHHDSIGNVSLGQTVKVVTRLLVMGLAGQGGDVKIDWSIEGEGVGDSQKKSKNISFNFPKNQVSESALVKLRSEKFEFRVDKESFKAGESYTVNVTVTNTSQDQTKVSIPFHVKEKEDDEGEPGDDEEPGDEDEPGDDTETDDGSEPGDELGPDDGTEPTEPDHGKPVGLEIEPTSPPLVTVHDHPGAPHPPYKAVFLYTGEATNLKALVTFSDDTKKDVTSLTKPPDGTPPPVSYTEWSCPTLTVRNGHVRAETEGTHHITARYFSTGHKTQEAKIIVEVEAPPKISVKKDAFPSEVPPGVETKVLYRFRVDNSGGQILENVDITDSNCSPLKPATVTTPYTTAKTMFPGDFLTFTCKANVRGKTTNTVTVEADYMRPGHDRLLTIKATASVTLKEGTPPSERTKPTVAITSHRDGDYVTTPTIMLRGMATDRGRGNNGIFMVTLKDDNNFFDQIYHVDLDSAPVKPGDRVVTFSQKLKLKPGPNKITVTAIDNSTNYNSKSATITVHYDPQPPPPEPGETALQIAPVAQTISIGETISFEATFTNENGVTRDITDDPEARWIPDKKFTAENKGTYQVTVIYKRMMKTATITVGPPPPEPIPDITTSGDGPPGGKWNILFKPDGTDRPNCFEFMLAIVGGNRVASPGVLTPAATREGWSIDTAGGAGPYEGWSWTDPKQANARMAELSVYGEDWYGCRQPPKVMPPRIGPGQASPLPPGVIPYGIWRKHHFIDPPNCYQFQSAPMEEADKWDNRGKWEREPNFFGPYAKSEVNAIMSNLSRYGGDYYGCLTGETGEDRGPGGPSPPSPARPTERKKDEYYTIRVSGAGWVPYAGPAHKIKGWRDYTVVIKPDSEKTIDQVVAEMKRNIKNDCVSDLFGIGPPGGPRFWTSGPEIKIKEGPIIKDYKYPDPFMHWPPVDKNGPSWTELLAMYCGGKQQDPEPPGGGTPPGRQPPGGGTPPGGQPPGGQTPPEPIDPDKLDPSKPDVASRIMEWVSMAEPLKNVTEGAHFRYDPWGRVVGTTADGGVIQHRHSEGSPTHVVWSMRKDLDSVNHCTVEEYVVAKLEKKSVDKCHGRYQKIGDLRGKSVDQAKATLSSAGFKFTDKKGPEAPSKEQEGTIESHTPGPGRGLKRGGTVELTFFGHYVPRQVAVPDVTGERDEKAISILEDAGFKIKRTEIKNDISSQKNFIVKDQEPAASRKAEKGTTVKLEVYGRYSYFKDAIAALEVCDIEKVKEFMGKMPSGEEKTEIEKRYKDLNSHLEQVDKKKEEAKEKFERECFDQAVSMLDDALATVQCADEREKITELIARYKDHSKRKRAEINELTAKARQKYEEECFDEALSLLDKALRTIRCEEYQGQIKRLIGKVKADQERRAAEINSMTRQAMAHYERGCYADALTVMNDVIKEIRCESNRKKAEELISKIENRIVALNDQMGRAMEQYNSGCFEDAQSTLNDLMKKVRCDQQLVEIRELIRKVENKRAELNKKMGEAYNKFNDGCYDEAESILQGVMAEVRCEKYRVKISRLIADSEKKKAAIQAEVNTAMNHYQRGDPSGAKTILEGVLSKPLCEDQRSKVKGLIARLTPVQEAIELPDLTGMKADDAARTLRNLGMAPSVREDKKPADKINEKRVYSQNPKARAFVKPGTRVDVYAYGKYEEEETTTERTGEPFYVVFDIHMLWPTNMPETKKTPSGADAATRERIKSENRRMMENAVNNMTIANTVSMSLSALAKKAVPYVLHISGNGLTKYKRNTFRNGDPYALSFSGNYIDKKSGARKSVQGAFLLKVLGIFDHINQVVAAYPDIKDEFRKSDSFLTGSRIDSSSGRFNFSNNEGAFQLGPLESGWSDGNKIKALELTKTFLRNFAIDFNCFIATAVYKNPLSPELLTLRRFRDTVLLSSESGQRLVNIYYRYGPRLAEEIKQRPLISRMIRLLLDRFVLWLERTNVNDSVISRKIVDTVVFITEKMLSVFIDDEVEKKQPHPLSMLLDEDTLKNSFKGKNSDEQKVRNH